MPISLSQLTANRKQLTVTFEGGDLHVEYYPQRLTARMLADFVAADQDKLKGLSPERVLEVVSSPTATLAVLLAGWDLADAPDGPVLPIDRETLEHLGLQVQWTILAAIMQDGSNAGEASAPAGSAKKRLSGATSSRTAH